MKKSIFVMMLTLILSPMVNNSYAQNKPVNPTEPKVKLKPYTFKCPTVESNGAKANSNTGGLKWTGGNSLYTLYFPSYAGVREKRVTCYYNHCDVNNQCGFAEYFVELNEFQNCEISKTNKIEFTCYKP